VRNQLASCAIGRVDINRLEDASMPMKLPRMSLPALAAVLVGTVVAGRGTPAGAAPTTAQFTGGVFRRDGRQLPPGTRVEAYVGGTRCGVASVRRASSYTTEYILAVVGPDSVSGCTRGAHLTFRINGRPAADTSVANTPPGQQNSLNLTLR